MSELVADLDPPGLSESVEFRAFRTAVPSRQVAMASGLSWKFYDYGPKSCSLPLVCLPGLWGTADEFYKQILGLSTQGFRVIAVHPPAVATLTDFVNAFDEFLVDLELEDGVALLGVGLGGLLAQCYADVHPGRVKTMVLCNSFIDTAFFRDRAACSPLFSWLPEFVLKRIVLGELPQGELDFEIVQSVDFMVEQVETLSQLELACRLSYTCEPVSLGPCIPDSRVMLMETLDEKATPDELIDELAKFYPNGRRAEMKTGGNFPHIANALEFNMHLTVHFRNLAVIEAPLARPEMLSEADFEDFDQVSSGGGINAGAGAAGGSGAGGAAVVSVGGVAGGGFAPGGAVAVGKGKAAWVAPVYTAPIGADPFHEPTGLVEDAGTETQW